MGKRLVVLVVFAALGSLVMSTFHATAGEWTGPPARWVSDLQGRDKPGTYNTHSAVSDDGRYVVFFSHVYDRPGKIYLMNTETGNFRHIDHAYDRGPRTRDGNIYSYAFSGGFMEITPDGRYVVFESGFNNLVKGDRNEEVDVFLYDRLTRRLRLVSRGPDGQQANGASTQPAVTPDGRFVAFASHATNLSDQDGGPGSDVYLRDLQTKEVTLVSVGPDGKGDRRSGLPGISDDGSRISFLSDARNLVEGDTNRAADAFVRDLVADETMRVSVSDDGEQLEPFVYSESASVYRDGAEELEISGNGEVVVFSSHANGLVSDDDNDNVDIFVHEIDTGVTERVSRRSDGGDAYRPSDKECGNNGQCFTFIQSHDPSISKDGQRVSFLSAAPLLSDEDEDERYNSGEDNAFVHDRLTDETVIVSRKPSGGVVESANWYPGTISSDGLWVTYAVDSRAPDGPQGDEDVGPDVFLQELPLLFGE